MVLRSAALRSQVSSGKLLMVHQGRKLASKKAAGPASTAYSPLTSAVLHAAADTDASLSDDRTGGHVLSARRGSDLAEDSARRTMSRHASSPGRLDQLVPQEAKPTRRHSLTLDRRSLQEEARRHRKLPNWLPSEVDRRASIWESDDIQLDEAGTSGAHEARLDACQGIALKTGEPKQLPVQEVHVAALSPSTQKAPKSLVQHLEYHVLLARGAAEKTAESISRVTGLPKDSILQTKPEASFLRPAYYVAADHSRRLIVVAFRGTSSSHDVLTSLSAHAVRMESPGSELRGGRPNYKDQQQQEQEQTLYYGHFGALQAAQWFVEEELPNLRKVLMEHEGYSLRLVGHSLGAAVASLLTVRLREHPCAALDDVIPRERISCVGVSTPPCMSHRVAAQAVSYVSTLVLQDDVVPRLSVLSVQVLVADLLLPWRKWLAREDDASRLHRPRGVLCTPGKVYHLLREPVQSPVVASHSHSHSHSPHVHTTALPKLSQSKLATIDTRAQSPPCSPRVASRPLAVHAYPSSQGHLFESSFPWRKHDAGATSAYHHQPLVPQHPSSHWPVHDSLRSGARGTFRCYACFEGQLLEAGACASADTSVMETKQQQHSIEDRRDVGRSEAVASTGVNSLKSALERYHRFLIVLLTQSIRPTLALSLAYSFLLSLLSVVLVAAKGARGERGRKGSRGQGAKGPRVEYSYALVEGLRCETFHRIVFSPSMLKDHRTYNILSALQRLQCE